MWPPVANISCSFGAQVLAQQGTNAAPLEVREALARAVEDAVGGAALQPTDLLQVLLACLDRALPTPPGQASIFQQLLGLQAHQARHAFLCVSCPPPALPTLQPPMSCCIPVDCCMCANKRKLLLEWRPEGW